MEESERMTVAKDVKADHLCVLVHGLWGNPGHLKNMAIALREKYGDKVHVLVASKNSDMHTYDGIEVGGERVAQEIEDELAQLEKTGHTIKKFSMAGYSLGGLIARYCIGLLDARGVFDNIEPINFTTFASPHLGVRTPLRAYYSNFWNALGSRTLSMSGQQLFLTDTFRDTGRMLLSILADPNTIFVKALAKFKHRVLYANIINDRSAPWYTTGISRTDPFTDLDSLELNYLPGYAPNILNPDQPIRHQPRDMDLSLYNRITANGNSLLTSLPFYAMMTLLLPIATVGFLLNSGIQNFRSGRRIRLHETAASGSSPFKNYRIPLLLESARSAVEGAFENLNANMPEEHDRTPIPPGTPAEKPASNASSSDDEANEHIPLTRTMSSFLPSAQRLALAPEQFEMIERLDRVGWRKFPVHIQKVRHSHAAIVVRTNRSGFDEGKVVFRHWLDECFEV